jgi:hypothetical protein
MVIGFLVIPNHAVVASTNRRMTARWYRFLPERMDRVTGR